LSPRRTDVYTSVRELRADLLERLGRGQHLVLYGPRGSGKSTLVAQLRAQLLRASIPCGLARSTSCLDDITRTLEAAYPQVNTQAVNRRTARYRLWSAADRRRCVLLLDHLTDVSTIMLGFLRRLRGGIAGVLFVVDVDVERERMRMRKRARSLGLSVRMPLASTLQLRTLLRARCAAHGICVQAEAQHQLLRTAQGRPGWIVLCTTLMTHGKYWHEGQLYPSLLCTDTEITLRQAGLHLLAPDDWTPASDRAWANPLTDYDEEAFWKNTRPSPPRKPY
jgi:energy-coupling factor transporter ATP-binding protein EcfA2